MYSNAMEQAAKHFIDPSLVYAQYSSSQYQQAMADLAEGLKNYNPTLLSIYDNTHAVVFKGTSWSKLADAISRPYIETVTVHDPAFNYDPATLQVGGPDVVISVGYFMNYTIANPSCGGCVRAIQMTGQYFSGNASLQGFNLDGGRYLGPTPASPTGRYMLDGNGACYWEPNDSGDDQCSVPPPPTGRWKGDGYGGCYWDPNDSGPDQCSPEPPPTGRWKGDGNGGCYWDPNDSGPDQCSP
jgi:hypothetical protein